MTSHPGTWPQVQPQTPPPRPTTLTAAAVLTIVGSGLYGLLPVIDLGMTGARPAQARHLAEGVRLWAMTTPAKEAFLVGISVLALAWAVGLVLLAIFVLRGRNGARVTLTVFAAAPFS